MSGSPDDRDFETIYRSIPVGLTVVAAKLDHFETFRAFCFSLKGAAIRLGSNAMLFLWQYSKRNWLTRGIQHLSSFVEKHKANGVRLFLIDQPTGWADREVAILIREVAEAADVCIILTSFAGPTTKGAMKRAAVLDGGVIEFFAQSAIALQCRSAKRIVRSEMAFPVGKAIRMSGGPADRKIEALRNLAERPGTEAEGKLAKETLARLDLPDRPTIVPGGSQRTSRLILEQTETVRDCDFYSATTIFGGQERSYGPLYFVERCPQPPESEIG